jgi:hypothetical protein
MLTLPDFLAWSKAAYSDRRPSPVLQGLSDVNQFIAAKRDAKAVLTMLRSNALAQGQPLRSNQLTANLSLAWACDEAPLGIELYEIARSFGIPRTPFFTENAAAIQSALATLTSPELLNKFAQPELSVALAINQYEQYRHPVVPPLLWRMLLPAYYFCPVNKEWRECAVPGLQWYDQRQFARWQLGDTPDSIRERALASLKKMRRALKEKPSTYKKQRVAHLKSAIDSGMSGSISVLAATQDFYRIWLPLRESTPVFKDEIAALLREAENLVRDSQGVPRVGEGWLSEVMLLNRVRALFPHAKVVHQGSPKWLGRQRFDIWIPESLIAIEYHGAQHYSPIEVFGGAEGFKAIQERDARKRALCQANDVTLIEVPYHTNLSDDELCAAVLAAM